MILIITIIYACSFIFATYTRIKSPDYFGENIFYDFIILLIGIISLALFIFLVKKSKRSIIIFNLVNILILFTLFFSSTKKHIIRKEPFSNDDYIFFPFFTLLFCFFIFLNSFFKFRVINNYKEIDEIGIKDE